MHKLQRVKQGNYEEQVSAAQNKWPIWLVEMSNDILQDRFNVRLPSGEGGWVGYTRDNFLDEVWPLWVCCNVIWIMSSS